MTIDIDTFDTFINSRYTTLRWYYRHRINEICMILNYYGINNEQLYMKLLYNETSKSKYSLYDLITDGLCPADLLIHDRIRKILGNI